MSHEAESTLDTLLSPIPADQKVTIFFRPVGNAPILQEPKLRVPVARPFSVLAPYLRNRLKLSATAPLYVYVNSAFIPAPDAIVKDVFDAFHTRDELVLHYALTEAWA